MNTHSTVTRTILALVALSTSSVWAENLAGQFRFPLGFGYIGGREVQVREPSMCDGGAAVEIDFDRDAGTVRIRGVFDGLPHGMDLCYEDLPGGYDPSTPYNLYPECVEDGKWQIWFAGRFLTQEIDFYYDAATSELLGSEFDVEPPPDAIALSVPVVQMVCSPLFESDPDTLRADVTFEFDYHRMLDAEGTAGVYATAVPADLDAPEALIAYYTNGGLPVSEAMDFDDVLRDVRDGLGGVAVAVSLEPDPKPAYLASRDNLMIGFGAGRPVDTMELFGLPVDTAGFGDCGTFQLPDPF